MHTFSQGVTSFPAMQTPQDTTPFTNTASSRFAGSSTMRFNYSYRGCQSNWQALRTERNACRPLNYVNWGLNSTPNFQHNFTSSHNAFPSSRSQYVPRPNVDGTGCMQNPAVLQNVTTSMVPPNISEKYQPAVQNPYVSTHHAYIVGHNRNVRPTAHGLARPLRKFSEPAFSYGVSSQPNVRTSHLRTSDWTGSTSPTVLDHRPQQATLQMSGDGVSVGSALPPERTHRTANEHYCGSSSKSYDATKFGQSKQRSVLMKGSCSLPNHQVLSNVRTMQGAASVIDNSKARKDMRRLPSADSARHSPEFFNSNQIRRSRLDQSNYLETFPRESIHVGPLLNIVTANSNTHCVVATRNNIPQTTKITVTALGSTVPEKSNQAYTCQTNINDNISASVVRTVFLTSVPRSLIMVPHMTAGEYEQPKLFVSNHDQEPFTPNTEAYLQPSILRPDQSKTAGVISLGSDNTDQFVSSNSLSQFHHSNATSVNAKDGEHQHENCCSQSAVERDSHLTSKPILQKILSDSTSEQLRFPSPSVTMKHDETIGENMDEPSTSPENDAYCRRLHSDGNGGFVSSTLFSSKENTKTQQNCDLSVHNSTGETEAGRNGESQLKKNEGYSSMIPQASNVGSSGFSPLDTYTDVNDGIGESQTHYSDLNNSKERELMNELSSENDLPFCYDYKSVLEAAKQAEIRDLATLADSSGVKQKLTMNECNNYASTTHSQEGFRRSKGASDASPTKRRRYKRIIEPPSSDSEDEIECEIDTRKRRSKRKRTKNKRPRITEPSISSTCDSDESRLELGLRVQISESLLNSLSPINATELLTYKIGGEDVVPKATNRAASETQSNGTECKNLSYIDSDKSLDRWSKCKVVLQTIQDNSEITKSPVCFPGRNEGARTDDEATETGKDGSAVNFVKLVNGSYCDDDIGKIEKLEMYKEHSEDDVSHAEGDGAVERISNISPYNVCVDNCYLDDTHSCISPSPISMRNTKDYTERTHAIQRKYGSFDGYKEDVNSTKEIQFKEDSRHESCPSEIMSSCGDDDSLSSSLTSTDSECCLWKWKDLGDKGWPFTDGGLSQESPSATDNESDSASNRATDIPGVLVNPVDKACGNDTADTQNMFDVTLHELDRLPHHTTIEGTEVQLTKSLKMRNLWSQKTLQRRKHKRALRQMGPDSQHFIPSTRDNTLQSNTKVREAVAQDENHPNDLSLTPAIEVPSMKSVLIEVMKRKFIKVVRPLHDSTNTDPR